MNILVSMAERQGFFFKTQLLYRSESLSDTLRKLNMKDCQPCTEELKKQKGNTKVSQRLASLRLREQREDGIITTLKA